MNSDNSLFKTFIKYIIPAMAAQLVYTLYAMVDAVFLARGVNEKALAAVNLCFPFVSVLFSLSLLIAVGTSAVASIYMGKGEMDKACERFSQSIFFNIIIGLFITVLSIIFLRPICQLLGNPDPETFEYMCQYLGWIIPFSVAFLLSYSMEILMKADGFPELSTMIVTLGVILNVSLDYILVMVVHKGAAGAAFATGFTQALLTCIYLVHFLGKRGKLKFRKFTFDLKDQIRIFYDGLSGGINEFSSGIVTFIFNHMILLYLDADKIVTYTLADYAVALIVLTANGLTQGAQPLISYYYGAKNLDNIKRLFKYQFISSVAFCLISFVILFFGMRLYAFLFISDTASSLYTYSVHYVRVCILCLLLAGVNVSMSGYYTSIERGFEAALISACRSMIMLLIAMLILIPILGGNGIWWAMPAAEVLTIGVTIVTLIRRPVFRFQQLNN